MASTDEWGRVLSLLPRRLRLHTSSPSSVGVPPVTCSRLGGGSTCKQRPALVTRECGCRARDPRRAHLLAGRRALCRSASRLGGGRLLGRLGGGRLLGRLGSRELFGNPYQPAREVDALPVRVLRLGHRRLGADTAVAGTWWRQCQRVGARSKCSHSSKHMRLSFVSCAVIYLAVAAVRAAIRLESKHSTGMLVGCTNCQLWGGGGSSAWKWLLQFIEAQRVRTPATCHPPWSGGRHPHRRRAHHHHRRRHPARSTWSNCGEMSVMPRPRVPVPAHLLAAAAGPRRRCQQHVHVGGQVAVLLLKLVRRLHHLFERLHAQLPRAARRLQPRAVGAHKACSAE